MSSIKDFDSHKIVGREFVSQSRYGYGAIDEYATDANGERVMLRNVFSGKWLTQKAAGWIAGELNAAYGNGKTDGGMQHAKGGESCSAVQRDVQTYPIAQSDVRHVPRAADRAVLHITNIRAVATGEYRAPRKGEWYLSGAVVEAYYAPKNTAYASRFPIARLVACRRVAERYEPIEDKRG